MIKDVLDEVQLKDLLKEALDRALREGIESQRSQGCFVRVRTFQCVREALA